MKMWTMSIDVNEYGIKRTIEIDIEEQNSRRVINEHGDMCLRVHLGRVDTGLLPESANDFIKSIECIRDELSSKGYKDIWFSIEHDEDSYEDILDGIVTVPDIHLVFGADIEYEEDR